MIDLGITSEIMNTPDWEDAGTIRAVFTFRSGLTKTVEIDVSDLDAEAIEDVKQQILGKRKLIQSIFEHNTHGQITVQGLTVRADDLISVEIY